jgi:hypothetical protein
VRTTLLIGYVFIGIGGGFAGTPASHSLTGLGPGRRGRYAPGYRRPATRRLAAVTDARVRR